MTGSESRVDVEAVEQEAAAARLAGLLSPAGIDRVGGGCGGVWDACAPPAVQHGVDQALVGTRNSLTVGSLSTLGTNPGTLPSIAPPAVESCIRCTEPTATCADAANNTPHERKLI
jgi:hypothetical protein